jgi:DHA3 family macrolide efflux protein-like MFS transporter
MFGIAGIGIGFLVFGFAPQSGFNLVLGASIFAGSMMAIANGAIGAILQTTVAPDMQGRVFTLVGSIAMGMSPIGLIIAGPVADAFGIQTWYWVGGMVCALLGVSGFFIPALMNIEKDKDKSNELQKSEVQQFAAASD